MIKKKFYSKGILITILLSSCNFLSQQTAKEMNDKLVTPTDSLYNKAVRWGTLFSNINSGDHNFQLLKPTRVDMENYINTSLNELKNLKDVNGSESLRQSVIAYLEFEKTEVKRTFIGVESLAPSSNEEDIKAMLDKLSDNNDEENNLLTRIKEAQQEYAKQNKFILMDKR